jgi:hypothetical protein
MGASFQLISMENNFKSIVQKKQGRELLEMVYQFDEWSPEMLQAVQAELERRQMLPDDIAARKQEIIDREIALLSKGKPASLMGQLFGWIGVLGVFGLIIGYRYVFTKVKSKYTGQKFYKYDKPSRDNGQYIFYTSLAAWILFGLYKIVTLNGDAL